MYANCLSVFFVASTAALGQTPSTEVAGATVRLTSAYVESTAPVAAGGPPEARVAAKFSIKPKNASEAVGYEIGEVFRARDHAGKEIECQLCRPHFSYSAVYWFGKFGPGAKALNPSDEQRVPIGFPGKAPVQIAVLEGDLFVAKQEVFDFAFAKDELKVNAVKQVGDARVTIFRLDDDRFDEKRLGLRVDLPHRSRAHVLADNRGSQNAHWPELYVEDKKGAVQPVLPFGFSGDQYSSHAKTVRTESTFTGPKLDEFEILHVVVTRPLEYPQRHRFTLKNVKIAPAPPQPKFAPPPTRRPIAAALDAPRSTQPIAY